MSGKNKWEIKKSRLMGETIIGRIYIECLYKEIYHQTAKTLILLKSVVLFKFAMVIGDNCTLRSCTH